MSDHRDILRDLKVEQRPISSLRPYARNPRTHSPAQIDKLASYPAAKKELMPGVEHRRHKGLPRPTVR